MQDHAFSKELISCSGTRQRPWSWKTKYAFSSQQRTKHPKFHANIGLSQTVKSSQLHSNLSISNMYMILGLPFQILALVYSSLHVFMHFFHPHTRKFIESQNEQVCKNCFHTVDFLDLYSVGVLSVAFRTD